MAEIEIGIMSRQCLSDYLANKDKFEAEVLLGVQNAIQIIPKPIGILPLLIQELN